MASPCNCDGNSSLTYSMDNCLENCCTDTPCTPLDNYCYTGPNLICTGINTGERINDVLTKFDIKLCAASGNYATYQTHCLAAYFGSPITSQAQFVDAISSYVCTTQQALSDFTGITFPAYQSTIAGQINGIKTPSLTCATAGVTSADNLTTVLTKFCAKFSSLDSAIDVSGVDFGACITTTQPTTIQQAFTAVEAQICSIQAALGEGGTVLPTFNNTGSCLASPLTATDSLVSTINKIKDKLCLAPSYDSNAITWGCVGTPIDSTLNTGLQGIITKLNYALPKTVTFGSGFTVTQTNVSNPCQGVTVNLAASTDRFVASNSSDTTPSTLDNKLLGTGIAIDSTTTAGKITLINDHKLLASGTDTVADFLINKINGSTASGITVTPTYNTTTKKVDLILTVDTSVFCTIFAGCANSVPCTTYTVTPSGSSSLNYTDCSGATISQTISGATTICAKLNSVYAPNATIVNGGNCNPAGTSVFILQNNSTTNVVSAVNTGGTPFFTTTSGAFPISSGQTLTGTGVTSSAVRVTLTSSTPGRAQLWRNTTLLQTLTYSSAGSIDFTAATYVTGTDSMKVVILDAAGA